MLARLVRAAAPLATAPAPFRRPAVACSRPSASGAARSIYITDLAGKNDVQKERVRCCGRCCLPHPLSVI